MLAHLMLEAELWRGVPTSGRPGGWLRWRVLRRTQAA